MFFVFAPFLTDGSWATVVIVVYVLDSGATLGLADARGYRCRNKGNVVVRCGDYRPVPRDPRARELFGSEPSSSRAVRKRAGALRSC